MRWGWLGLGAAGGDGRRWPGMMGMAGMAGMAGMGSIDQLVVWYLWEISNKLGPQTHGCRPTEIHLW